MRYLTTREVAAYLRLNEKKIYAMVAAGELPASRISGKWLFDREAIDRWVAEHTLLPPSGLMEALSDRVLVVQGSDEWLLDRAIGAVRPGLDQAVATASVGSFAGLSALGRGQAHIAGIHVADDDLPSAMEELPPTYLVGLFRRQQVLVLRPGLGDVAGLADVADRGLRFAARQPASGTWRLTQRLLADVGREADSLQCVGPYDSHIGVALAIASGDADAGLAIRVAADLAHLPRVPILEETYRLAIPARLFGRPSVARFLERTLEHLDSHRRAAVPGYGFEPLGRLRPPTAAA
jgi:putative molybdopterin biosynthesis protein